jgi:hypothetical protein
MVRNGNNVSICIWYEMVIMCRSAYGTKWVWYENYFHYGTTTHYDQGFQSGPVPGTFTRLRSCIVPAEITEPPKKLAVVKTTSTIGLWNIFHKIIMITSIAEFSHSNHT